MEVSSNATTRKAHLVRASVVLVLFASAGASAQSLAELAKREKERRAALQAPSSRTFTNVPSRRERAKSAKLEAASEERASEAAATELPPSTVRRVSVSVSETPQVVSVPPTSDSERLATGLLPDASQVRGVRRTDWVHRGTYSLDWFRTFDREEVSAGGQFSGRLKLELGERPGEGWRALVDVRDRFQGGSRSSHRVMLYDARLVYESRERPLGLSIGRMNLYDSAGAGPLLGGVASYRLSPSITTGSYAGLEPAMYLRTPDPTSQKYGVFTRYLGPKGRSLAASYNLIRFRGATERQFLYATGLLPLPQPVVVFGNVEYELNGNVASKDRLSRLFLNARWDPSPLVDVTAHVSSGRGLDYRRFVLEQSQNLRPDATEIERYYYSRQIGARVHLKPSRSWTVFLSQALNEQKDRGIENHTTEIGGSVMDLGGSGLTVTGGFSLNRGASAESSSYRISASRDFGNLSWTGTYSSVFTGIRLDPTTGLPELVRAADRRVTSNELFWVFRPELALSVEHELASGGGGIDENTLFIRLMGRF